VPSKTFRDFYSKKEVLEAPNRGKANWKLDNKDYTKGIVAGGFDEFQLKLNDLSIAKELEFKFKIDNEYYHFEGLTAF